MALWIMNPAEPNAEPTHQGLTPATTFQGLGTRGGGIGADHSLPPYIELFEPTYVRVLINFELNETTITYIPPRRHLLTRYLYEPGQQRFFGGQGTDHPGLEAFFALNAATLSVDSVIFWSAGFESDLFANTFSDPVCTWYLAFDLQGVAHVSGSGATGLPDRSWIAFITPELFPRTLDPGDFYFSWFSAWFSGHKNGFQTLGSNSFDDPFRTELINTGLGHVPDTTTLEALDGFDANGKPNGERWWRVWTLLFNGGSNSLYILQDADRLLVRPWWP